jgi:hypothetical protein
VLNSGERTVQSTETITLVQTLRAGSRPLAIKWLSKESTRMFRINAENIRLLRDTTGKPFTVRMDSLIRARTSLLRIPAADVWDNSRINLADGGVDTQVNRGSKLDETGYFVAPSAWQYKAMNQSDLKDQVIRGEISGPSKVYLRKLIADGYAYRMCIADDGPPERKSHIKALLDEEIRKYNPEAPEALVLLASDIFPWVNEYPAIAAEMLGAPTSSVLHFRAWGNQECAQTKIFIQTDESQVISENIRQHLDWGRKVTSAGLTISGDAGVGKSRTVYEAVAALAGVAPMVLYTNDEEDALDIARALANETEPRAAYAVLVADECQDATAYRLSKQLKGIEHRVRVITIDNALDRPSQGELRLSKLPTNTVNAIVSANFGNIDAARVFRYCDLAQGYLRFAIFLCENDALIVEQGHLGELLNSTQGYLSTLFGNGGPFRAEDFEALMVISLVERCGVVENRFVELEGLCELVELDANVVRERLHAMQKKNGLVARAGRYFYVTPTPVAMVCFQKAWTRWAELRPKEFLDAFPQDLMPQLLARVSQSEGVGKVVNAYFRDWEISRGGDIFTDVDETERLLLLVRANPDEMIPRLRNLVLRTDASKLTKTSSGRRNLVVEAGEISAFPQWFAYAEEILFRLASDETEPGIGNNASEIWSSLFQIFSYTGSPFPERFLILKSRIQGAIAKEKLLCVLALRKALDDRSPYLMSTRPYGNRIAPTRWQPVTFPEWHDLIKQCLTELKFFCGDADLTVREKAGDALVRSIRSLVFHGHTDHLRDGADDLSHDVRPLLRAELREFLLLNNSEHSPHSEEEKKRRAVFVEAWIEDLASDDVHSQLVEDVGSNAWEHHLEQAAWELRLRGIATRLVNEPGAFEAELSWLNSEYAKSTVEFGTELAEVDAPMGLLKPIVMNAISVCNANLVRGYFLGLRRRASQLSDESAKPIRAVLGGALDELWQADATLGFNAMTPLGDFANSFERALAAVRDKQIPGRYLNAFTAWNGPCHTTRWEARLAMEVLLKAAAEGDAHAANIGLDFIVFVLMRMVQGEDKLWLLQRLFDDDHLTTIFALMEHAAASSDKLSAHFGHIFARVLPANPMRGTEVVLKMMDNHSYEVSREAAGLFPTLVSEEPEALMEGLGDILLKDDYNSPLSFRSLPLTVLPDEIVIRWLEKHGLVGARVLARHLTRPYMDSGVTSLHPVTGYVLEKFGGDDAVFSRWLSGMNNGHAFAGSIADHIDRRASAAEAFLQFPVEAVRRWAESEVLFADQNSPRFRLAEEEGF